MIAWLRGMRTCWGLALLITPRPVLRAVGRVDRPVPRATLVTIRVLGVRHLIQALVEAVGPWPSVGYLGAGADGLHALGDVGLAVAAPRWRRGALIDTTIAAVFAASTIRSLRSDAHEAT